MIAYVWLISSVANTVNLNTILRIQKIKKKFNNVKIFHSNHYDEKNMNNEDFDPLKGPIYVEGVSKLPLEGEEINGYELISNISNTHYSIVFTCWKKNKKNSNSDKKVIKFIKRREEDFNKIINELTTMSIARNSRIMILLDFFSYNEYVCLITPFAKYGNLKDFISTRYPVGIEEDLASTIMKQMIEGVLYLHSINIIHRDVKPANILITEDDVNNFQIVLCDFGLSTQYSKDEKNIEKLGTYSFTAPEIYKNEPYGFSIDIWSLGITLFNMLSGCLPFPKNRCALSIVKGQLYYEFLDHVTNEGKELVRAMCKVDPDQRIQLIDASNHEWFKKHQKDNELEKSMFKYIIPNAEIKDSS